MVRKTQVKNYILDACALIAFLRKEFGSEHLLKLFQNPHHRFFLHSVNLGEVYYDTLRLKGANIARELFLDIAKLPVEIIWNMDRPFIELAGKYKTAFRISYADSYVLALAEREKGIVLTTDHSEFDIVEESGKLTFFWLR